MTYIVSSGALNSTHSLTHRRALVYYVGRRLYIPENFVMELHWWDEIINSARQIVALGGRH